MSEVSICNSALIKLGADRIISLDTKSKEGRLCKEQFPKLRDKLLRSHNWNFATKRAPLAKTTNTPVFEYDNEFQLPSDFLQIVSTDIDETVVRADLGFVSTSLNNSRRFRVEGNKLLTNFDEVNIEYIFRQLDTTRYEANFSEALSLLLASDIAYAMTQSRNVAKDLFAEYKDAFAEARTIDAQQGTPLRPLEGSWIPTRI